MSAAVCDLVLRAKREKPRRSIRRIIALLERAKLVRKGELSSSSVHRLLEREGLSARPGRGAEDEAGHAQGTRIERRSYIAEHVGDLWVGDALHVHRRVRFASGRIGKAYLLSQIDSASRYVPHSYLAAHEQDSDQEHGCAADRAHGALVVSRSAGREVDFLLQGGGALVCIECKWTELPQPSDARWLRDVHELLASAMPGIRIERQIAARPRSSYPMPDGTRVVHGAMIAKELFPEVKVH